jgi:hypothetical protein
MFWDCKKDSSIATFCLGEIEQTNINNIDES